MGQRWPDCDSVLRDWVTSVVNHFHRALGSNHVGTYLHGSLAAGAFYPPKSDVDLLVICLEPLSSDQRRFFARCCVELHEQRPIIGGLECSVIIADAAQAPQHPMPFEVHFGEDWVSAIREDAVNYTLDQRDPDLIAHCQAVLESGVSLSGPSPSSVFGPVDRPDFLKAVDGDFEWILTDDHILQTPVYGVLNCCRMLWVWGADTRRLVPTKEEAALWCIERVPQSVREVVERALTVYRSDKPVSAQERRTGGEVWDPVKLGVFTDYVRAVEAARRAS